MGIKSFINNLIPWKNNVVSMPIIFGESGPRSYFGSIGELERIENGEVNCCHCSKELGIRTIKHTKKISEGEYSHSCGKRECKQFLTEL